jgi:DNA invertase Pin-like site-specific DNA recombinase
MEVGIYARRSRPEELEPDSVREFETSTERQLGACKQHADAKGWTVNDRHIYREAGVSGIYRNSPRPIRAADRRPGSRSH